MDFLSKLLDTTGFVPRWNCGDWSQGHGWLHILSDLAIFGAYAAIPISITTYILVKKHEIAFRNLYWLFASFVLSCGFTHLIDASLYWQPWYRLSGSLKLVTAIVSWATVVALVRTLPVAFKIPGTAKLAERLMEEVEVRKLSEQTLQEVSTRLTLAMEHSRLGDWSWDARKDVCHFSPRAAEILNLPAGSAQTWENLLSRMHEADRDEARKAFHNSIAEHTDYNDEYRIQHQGKGEIWIAAKGRAQYDTDGQVISMIGTMEDVSKRKLADAEREELLKKESQARNAAERANLMKDEFLATLSHELRTPLSAILGWSTLLRNDHTDEEELNLGLEVIERNTHMQARLIEDLLDMSRIISGKIRLDVQPVDLPHVIEAALDTVRASADSKKVRLISVLDPHAGPVRGDPARLQQIVWNLLTNAIRFTPSGGKVEVTLERVNSHLEITVSDTGAGIDPEFLPYVFDRFMQADSSITRKHGGLGLGLSIVKNLTDLHGGSVHAKSQGEGLGATFRVALPLPVTHPGALSAHGRAHPTVTDRIPTVIEERPDLTGAHILILDDEADCLILVKTILEKQGAIVTTASRGEEALQALTRQAFHAFISDLGMPDMDGYDVIRKVRSHPAPAANRVPAIVLTAFARSEDRRKAMIAGFDTFVSKPVDPSELLAAVARSVTRGKQAAT